MPDMPRLTAQFRDLEPAHFDVPPPADIEAFFAFGLHKAGSSLLSKVWLKLCAGLHVPDISFSETLFSQGHMGVTLDTCTNIADLVKDGYCYRGFRTFPAPLATLDLFRRRPKILLARDPRDAIVSSFFSFNKGSHGLPRSGDLRRSIEGWRREHADVDIDASALETCRNYRDKMRVYREAFNGVGNVKIYRYEDIIFEKKAWILDMLRFAGLEAPEALVDAIVQDEDVRPRVENPAAHIRKVTPGDYREKLRRDTIRQITDVLAEEMAYYGYPTDEVEP
jgi:hypothetical protein